MARLMPDLRNLMTKIIYIFQRQRRLQSSFQMIPLVWAKYLTQEQGKEAYTMSMQTLQIPLLWTVCAALSKARLMLI